MDRINAILWLKCRLTMRGHQTSATSTVGTVLLLVFTFLSLSPAALVLAAFLSALGRELALELTHIALATMYVVWIGFPIMGFKINEFFDVTRLLHYPVPATHLFAAGMLSSFLDLSSFLIYPFLLAVVAGNCEQLWQVLPAGLVIGLFTLQTFATGQLVLFLLVHILNHRRVSELALIALPLCLFLAVCGMELNALVNWPSVGRLQGMLPPSTFIAFLPPGIAANALGAIRAGDALAALYHTLVLGAVGTLTVVVAGRLTDRLLRQDGPLEALAGLLARVLPGRRARAAGAPARPSRLALACRRIFGGPQIYALAVKELALLVREPQVRMALGFYVATTALMVFAGMSGAASEQTTAILPLMSFSAVFILSAVLLNSLALEREGLRFLMAAPLKPLTLLVGNNMAQWALVTGVSTACLVAVAMAFRISLPLCAAHVYMTQSILWLLMGFGNISSVLVPYRLPAKGLHPKQATGGGQAFLVFVMGSVASSGSVLLASLAVVSLFLPPVRLDMALIALNVPFALGGIFGVYAVCTAAAAWALEHRRERLLREVAD